MCSDHNLRVNSPLEGSHCPNLYAGAQYSFIYIEIYSCFENTYIEGVKDCLAETATKGRELRRNDEYYISVKEAVFFNTFAVL